MQMVGAGREPVAGTEDLPRELAVGTVRPVEGPAGRHGPTGKSGVHPIMQHRRAPAPPENLQKSRYAIRHSPGDLRV